MTELTKGIFGAAKQIYKNNKGSVLRTIVYTIGHFVIAISVLMLNADKSYDTTIRMKLNCKRRILEINWGALTLRRKENGLWEENWNKYARHGFMRVLVPTKEPKQFDAGGFLIFQETAEGAYNSLCKK